jgi:hypothetical protein
VVEGASDLRDRGADRLATGIGQAQRQPKDEPVVNACRASLSHGGIGAVGGGP